MTIPFLDLRAVHRDLREEIERAVSRVLASGRYLFGPEAEAFEHAFASYVGTKHCIGVGSGLDALHLALRALGVGPGDDVIVPAHTFIATWLAVSHAGATPVPVEPDPRTYTIDPSKLEQAITPRTKAIVAVHLYGQPADMDAIAVVAGRCGIPIVEDAAQAHGARHRGRSVGSFGAVAAWSFYPGKNLGALGDAGAVTTEDAGIARSVRMLRDYGANGKYRHVLRGFNSRIDEIQAAILRVKLERLDEWNERRRKIAGLYLDALWDTEIVLPFVPAWAEHVWHLFVVRSRARDALQRYLGGAGIETIVHYPTPPHRQQAYTGAAFSYRRLPITEAICREVLSLPIGPHLAEGDVAAVIEAIRRFHD
jgi:dTDP-4-amino-4,6-dideoxygalactose transaminase